MSGNLNTQTVSGRDLRVGDTIEVWWAPHRDTIIDLVPYEGPLKYLWEEDGGAQVAAFGLNKIGMTIEPHMSFRVISRSPLLRAQVA